MRYCDVIVDISAEALDRLFSYVIPDGLTLAVGQRVLVPFGPRKLEGYVLGFRDHVDMDPAKVRAVIRTLEPYPAILPELIELAKWMKDKYHTTLSEALRQMIPAQRRGERVKEKTVRVASLTVTGDALNEAIATCSRSTRQKSVLELLKYGPIEVPRLGELVPGVSAVLSALTTKGFVDVHAEETLRTPYQAIDTRRIVDPVLTDAQQAAVDAIGAALDGGGGRFLLHGVTGSGKTEVYIGAIRHALDQGKTAIVLVPEIALTPQMVDWFRARFGGDAAVLHSRLSPGERYDEWRRIRLGDARVAIGARSCVFAPMQNLGIIIVDEEHEHTYKSDRRPCYDAREIAQFRAEQSRGVMILGSATPSIQTYMKTTAGVKPENKLSLLELNERVLGRRLPDVEIVDMRQELLRGNKSMFSASLQAELRRCLDEGHQAMLFLNRRGHSTFVSCRACGYVERCENCDVALTFHQHEGLLRCHYCDAVRVPPQKCPQCGSAFIKYFGAGTQKVEEEVHRLFPDAAVLRMDMDTTRGKDKHEEILSAFRRGEAQILIGTQMIAKGLDFPNVTLVGVVAADMTLNLPDYRSVERTFQLVTQVAGRAGRADAPGRVVVQTYDPDHFAIQLAAKQDYRAFYHQEAKNRRRGLYPPYTVIARLLVTADAEPDASREAARLEKALSGYLESENLMADVVQVRALEAPLKRIKGESRHMVFIKMYAKGAVDRVMDYMEQLARAGSEVARIELEINPTNML